MTTGRIERAAGAAPTRIAVVASLTRSLLNFRLDLLRSMVEQGHEVHALAPDDDPETVTVLKEFGIRFERIPMSRAGVNPVTDLATLVSLWRALRRIRPDVLLPYTMKPIVYGLIAGRLLGTPRRYALVTGLGYAFGDYGASLKRMLVKRLSVVLYRFAFRGVRRVFVYNAADAEDILRARMVSDRALVRAVPGTGVNLERFQFREPSPGGPVFLMIARLLREKGVLDYLAAARLLKPRWPNARFQLLGPLDPNPSGISARDVEAWAAEGVISYLGETEDVRPFLSACDVFVLPTYYREGVPRTIQEALATGRAVVTTGMAGCRETVEDGVNGRLVRPRDPEDLAAALERFLKEPGLARRMGRESRRLAETRYDVAVVNRILLGEMDLVRRPETHGPVRIRSAEAQIRS